MGKLRSALITGITTSFLLGSPFNIDSSIINKKSSYEKPVFKKSVLHKIPWEKDFDYIPEKAVFNKLEKDKCASYALLSSQKNFGYRYHWEDAWNLKYSNDSILLPSSEDLFSLRMKGELKQGHLIGFYLPSSPRNNEFDCQGNKRDYTHVAVFIGKDENGKLIFDHQMGKTQERKTLEELSKEYSMKPVEIIHPFERI